MKQHTLTREELSSYEPLDIESAGISYGGILILQYNGRRFKHSSLN